MNNLNIIIAPKVTVYLFLYNWNIIGYGNLTVIIIIFFLNGEFVNGINHLL